MKPRDLTFGAAFLGFYVPWIVLMCLMLIVHGPPRHPALFWSIAGPGGVALAWFTAWLETREARRP